jgi:putative ABC transport system ATP-binding protein
MRFLDITPRSRWLSAAGGVSVAYVFVHILPDLAASEETLRKAAGESLGFLEHHVYLLALLGLPAKLSGGEHQRGAVAHALANRPSLILANEPTAALDSVRGRKVMQLLAKVAHEQGAGVIVVTHDHRALDVFDRILEIDDGHLRHASAPTASGRA